MHPPKKKLGAARRLPWEAAAAAAGAPRVTPRRRHTLAGTQSCNARCATSHTTRSRGGSTGARAGALPAAPPNKPREPDLLILSPVSGRRLLKDAAAISGLKRRRIMWDSLKTRGGRAVLRQIVRDEFGSRWAALTGRERRGGGSA